MLPGPSVPRGAPPPGTGKTLFIFLRNRLVAFPLLRAGLLLTIANVLTGMLGYAFQVIMGRMLTPAEFALFSAIMAVSMVFSSPLGTMFMVISRRVSTFRVHRQMAGLRTLYWRTHQYLAMGGILFLLLMFPLIDQAQIWLKSPSSLPIWMVGVFMVFMSLGMVNNAFFQGTKRFGWLGGIGALAVAFKILFSVLLVAFGFGVGGAMGGVMISAVLVWMLSLVLNTRSFPASNTAATLPIEKFPINTVVPVLVANVAFAIMTQIDMALVNWFFPSDQAGLYAAASVLGKAVLYLPGGLVLALYPMVAENHAQGKGSARMLMSSVIIIAVVCGGVALIYWIGGNRLISLLYGSGYDGAGELLRWYGFAILPMTLVMVAEHFLIAKGRVLFAWLFLAIAPLQVLAIFLWHDQLWQVIAIMGICGSALVAIGYGMLWREYTSS